MYAFSDLSSKGDSVSSFAIASFEQWQKTERHGGKVWKSDSSYRQLLQDCNNLITVYCLVFTRTELINEGEKENHCHSGGSSQYWRLARKQVINCKNVNCVTSAAGEGGAQGSARPPTTAYTIIIVVKQLFLRINHNHY